MEEIYLGMGLLVVAFICSYIGLRVKGVGLGKILSLLMLFGYLTGWSFISSLIFGVESSGFILVASVLIFSLVMTGVSVILTFKFFTPKAVCL